MTRNTITIELTCNGKTLRMGPNEDIDITKVTGLESSELELSTSDNALVDGASVDGKKIKPRPIHIEASFKSNKNNPENRARVIQFFNPRIEPTRKRSTAGPSSPTAFTMSKMRFMTGTSRSAKTSLMWPGKVKGPPGSSWRWTSGAIRTRNAGSSMWTQETCRAPTRTTTAASTPTPRHNTGSCSGSAAWKSWRNTKKWRRSTADRKSVV